MKNNKALWKVIASSAILFTTATSLVACGSDDSKSVATPSSAPSSSEAEAPIATDAPSPEVSTSSSVRDVDGMLSFNEEKEKVAARAATSAANWHSGSTEQVLVNGYKRNGFSEKAAESFKAVWSEIYDPKIVTTFGVQAQMKRVWLNDVAGEAGARTYRVGVLLSYKADWMMRSGGASGQPTKEATWWITMDEKTGEITKVDQPTKGELNIDLGE